MTRKQKKELGLLPLQVIRGIKELKEEGELGPVPQELTATELSFVYITHVMDSADYGAAWQQVNEGTYGIDMDELIRLVTLIMELIKMFGPLFL